MKRKKVGLALGSGGPKGLVHIGVLKVLLANNIPIDFISGCSIGAWVGAHYALFQDIVSLEKEMVYDYKEKLWSLFDFSLSGGLIKGDKVSAVIIKRFGKKTFKDLNIPFQTVAVDLLSGKCDVLKGGMLAPAVQASMAVPALFKPVRIGDKYYVDGGIADPVPDELVRNMGADIVISVNLDNCLGKNRFNEKDLSSVAKVSARSLDIIRHNLARATLNSSDVVISPCLPISEYSYWRQYFLGKMGVDLVKLGEKEARKMLPKIKALLNP